MSDLTNALIANRAAVDDLIAAGEKSGPAFQKPRAPGKWSPAQIEEHVALALEESARFVAGEPTRLPKVPSLLRPVLRGLFFNRVLVKGGFPNARTAKALDPPSGPETPAAARRRLDEAVHRFDEACKTVMSRGQTHVVSPVFGSVAITDLARFQELHTRHHLRQIPVPPA
jgi:hypothetical protein